MNPINLSTPLYIAVISQVYSWHLSMRSVFFLKLSALIEAPRKLCSEGGWDPFNWARFKIFCRFKRMGAGARWPSGRGFGCSPGGWRVFFLVVSPLTLPIPRSQRMAAFEAHLGARTRDLETFLMEISGGFGELNCAPIPDLHPLRPNRFFHCFVHREVMARLSLLFFLIIRCVTWQSEVFLLFGDLWLSPITSGTAFVCCR